MAGRGSCTVTGGHQRDQVRANLRGRDIRRTFYPKLYPNITRLRPTRLDEDRPEIRVPGASSDIIRHPDTH